MAFDDEDTEDIDDEEGDQGSPRGSWTTPARPDVIIETGRGQTTSVPAGSPFASTINELAERANYGGFFRVYLNGDELVDPADAPEILEPGMRVALTSYDKVG